MQVLHVIKSDVDNLELRLGIVDGVIERQSTSSIRLSLKTQVLRVDPCAAVWLPVGGAWSMYGMRCADLCGLVAFARCAARSLYMMRCADLCGLVAFCRAVRLQFCAVRLRRFVLRMRMRVACALHGTVSMIRLANRTLVVKRISARCGVGNCNWSRGILELGASRRCGVVR